MGPSYNHLRCENGRLKGKVTDLTAEVKDVKEENVHLTTASNNIHARNERLAVTRDELQLRLRILDGELDASQKERQELDRRFHELVNENDRQLQQSDQARTVQESQSRELEQANDASRKIVEELKEQVVQYKAAISASTRVGNQAADDQIERKVTQIYFSLQNLVAQKFRGVNLSTCPSVSSQKGRVLTLSKTLRRFQTMSRSGCKNTCRALKGT